MAATPAVLLMGPTAAGKSALALALAERLDGEIVSVDSAQIYRGLNIGTAKPDAGVRSRVPHHLVDIIDPTETYSAARFASDALAAIAGIRRRGRVPVVAGGTMLYFQALSRAVDAASSASASASRDRRARRARGMAGTARAACARRPADGGTSAAH